MHGRRIRWAINAPCDFHSPHCLSCQSQSSSLASAQHSNSIRYFISWCSSMSWIIVATTSLLPWSFASSPLRRRSPPATWSTATAEQPETTTTRATANTRGILSASPRCCQATPPPPRPQSEEHQIGSARYYSAAATSTALPANHAPPLLSRTRMIRGAFTRLSNDWSTIYSLLQEVNLVFYLPLSCSALVLLLLLLLPFTVTLSLLEYRGTPLLQVPTRVRFNMYCNAVQWLYETLKVIICSNVVINYIKCELRH